MPGVDWVTDATTKAASSYTKSYRISANSTVWSRSAEIKFTTKSKQNSATVTISQKGAGMPEYKDADYSLPEGAAIFSEKQADEITANDPASKTLTFASDSKNVPQAGQILIVPTVSEALPNGLVCKIKSVSKEGSNTVATYEYIPIEKAFESLSINETGIDMDGSIKSITDGDGNPIDFTKTKAQGKYHLKIPEFALYNDAQTLIAKFNIDMDLDMSFQMEIDGFSIKKFALDAVPTFNFDVAMEANVQADWTKRHLHRREQQRRRRTLWNIALRHDRPHREDSF